MGCGASTDGAKVQAPVAATEDGSTTAPPPPPPAAKDGSSEWHLLQYVDGLHEVTQGIAPPGYFLAVHDNKHAGMPRLSVVCVADGCVEPVRIKDKGRGLAEAMDLECLFMIDAKVAGKKQPLYVAVTSKGRAFLFKVSLKHRKWVAHGVKTFSLAIPPSIKSDYTNVEGARAYLEDGRLFLEFGNRGGVHHGKPVIPWVARHPLDVKAIRKGYFELDHSLTDVTYWPSALDSDPEVRQCSDMGQAIGMAKYGQLFSAAKDDEANETNFVSYIMERLPGAQTGGVENFKPLFRVQGYKIEAVYDITKDVSVVATDDEGKGAVLMVLHRHSGLAWRVQVVTPPGEDPRVYGISGLAPVDPAILKSKDDSSSESEASEDDDEDEPELEPEPQRDDDDGGYFGGGGGRESD